MKRVTLFFLILTIYGCNTPTSSTSNSIVVSILPLKYIVDKISGSSLDITVLVPPGSSPETYEITAAQAAYLESTNMIFTTGLLDFEQSLIKKARLKQGADIVPLARGIELITSTCQNHSHVHGPHAHSLSDPHIWTSPSELKIMAKNIYDALIRHYPDSLHYTKNYNQFIDSLDSLDVSINQLISGSHVNHFIIYHPALTYYCRRYGVEQIALEQDGKEPSAKYIQQIINNARKTGVKAVFYQSQFDKTVIETVANDIGAQAYEIDPLKENVAENLLHITRLIFQ